MLSSLFTNCLICEIFQIEYYINKTLKLFIILYILNNIFISQLETPQNFVSTLKCAKKFHLGPYFLGLIRFKIR